MHDNAQSEPCFDFDALSPAEIQITLKNNKLNLTPSEALTIQNNILNRPPSLSECILWSIQGSEHCSYKTSRQYLKQFPIDGPNVLLGPKEDAGIITIAQDNNGLKYGLVVSHESHNHPSQLLPFEGAATGVGGNVRDVCCMGAEVIAVADSLRFGDYAENKTHWIKNGVVSGIASYANALGIPNIAGDCYFNKGYNDNCLVTVVTLGIVPEDKIIHSYAPKNSAGYKLILVGKPTDDSGFGGASFASLELSEEDEENNRSAVQEPNAFLERHLLKASYALFDILKQKELINRVGFKDLGAGGIACAAVELADSAGMGAEINLDAIPVSMQNLPGAVILCSETQERFMWVVPNDLTDLILNHYNQKFDLPNVSMGAQAKIIGEITDNGYFTVHHRDHTIVHAKAEDITQGLKVDRDYKIQNKPCPIPEINSNQNFSDFILDLLNNPNLSNKQNIYNHYDKQVQGRVYIERGMGDCGVLTPFNSKNYPSEIQNTAVSLATAHNPYYGTYNAYWTGINSVITAVNKIAASGCQPLAITDCLCFGNPENPEQMGDFVESCRGIAETCNALSIPVIGGNVSLYNETNNQAIPASPIISCVGNLKNYKNIIKPGFNKTNSELLLLGEIQLGLPEPDLNLIKNNLDFLFLLFSQNLVLSSKAIHDGGIALALCKQAFVNNIGCEINLEKNNYLSEWPGVILEIDKNNSEQINNLSKQNNINIITIGHTIDQPILKFAEDVDLFSAKRAYHDR